MGKLALFGWLLTAVLAVVFFLVFFGFFNLVDCHDGGFPAFSQSDCQKLWCSSLNKRVENLVDCPFSSCPDGNQSFNLYYCQKYECDDNSIVGKPDDCFKFACKDGNRVVSQEECLKVSCKDGRKVELESDCFIATCFDGNKTQDKKECKEYCVSASDCNPSKVAVSSCFGTWSCNNNSCSWGCDFGGGFSGKKAKDVAILLPELVDLGYTLVGSENNLETTDGGSYSANFENSRDKVSFGEAIVYSTKGIQKVEFASSFNKTINEMIKQGNEPFGDFNFGDDRFVIKVPFSMVTYTKTDYGATYYAFFRKANYLVVLLVNTTEDKATGVIEEFASKIDSRI